MNQDVDQILKNVTQQGYFTDIEYKKKVGEILCHTPLTVEIFNIICNRLPQQYGNATWFLDEFGGYLWEKAQHPNEWMLWGGQKPSVRFGSLDVDAVLAGSDNSGRWFDHFAYRWNENSLETLDETQQRQHQIFFDTAWHYAISTENITVLKKMFGSAQWCTALKNRVSGRNFPLDFEYSTVEIVTLLIQSQALPFETILQNQLKEGYSNEILEFLLTDPRATPEYVAQQYLEHWNGPYPIYFSKALNNLIPNSETYNLDAFHNTVVGKCFSRRRRELPYNSPELFVTCLRHTPLFDDVKFMAAIVHCLDMPKSEFARPPQFTWSEILKDFVYREIIETFVNSMSPNDWGQVVANHPNSEFLQEFPRWQKHILLQQIDLQASTSGRRKI